MASGARGYREQALKLHKLLLRAALLVIATPALTATPARAFDEQREGFILGFGAGFHILREDYPGSGTSIWSRSEGGLATSFKVGAGITNQVALCYVRNASWYSAPYTSNGSTRDALYTIGLSGIGASYFLSPTAPSVYLLGGLGIGDISAPFENVKSETGSAVMLGAGYEFAKHLMIEGTVQSTSIPSAGLNLRSSSLQLTINYLFY